MKKSKKRAKKIKDKIRGDTELVCPVCKERSIADAWDNITYESCSSRQSKREYVSIKTERACNKKDRVLYICPECMVKSYGMHIRTGTNLINKHISDEVINEDGGEEDDV